MHVGALAVLSPPEGDYAGPMCATRSPLRWRATRWRRCGGGARRSLSSLGQWYWHTDTEVDLHYHVQIGALPPRAGETGLWKLASELHAAMLDRSRPLWQMHLIEGLPGGRYAFYIKTHSALADGVSAMRLLPADHQLRPGPARDAGSVGGDRAGARRQRRGAGRALRSAAGRTGSLGRRPEISRALRLHWPTRLGERCGDAAVR